MLTVLGSGRRYCGGLSRAGRRPGGGRVHSPALLRAEATSATRRPQKSVIVVSLSGGLAHPDTFDLKPGALPARENE